MDNAALADIILSLDMEQEELEMSGRVTELVTSRNLLEPFHTLEHSQKQEEPILAELVECSEGTLVRGILVRAMVGNNILPSGISNILPKVPCVTTTWLGKKTG